MTQELIMKLSNKTATLTALSKPLGDLIMPLVSSNPCFGFSTPSTHLVEITVDQEGSTGSDRRNRTAFLCNLTLPVL
jgi:hypothetical protein